MIGDAPAPAIDLDAARTFLLTLGGPEGRFTFQTFGDAEKRPRLSRIFHGTLDEHAAALTALNDAGAGIFVTVNETDLKGRGIVNVTRIRALFVDFDELPTAEPGVPPSIVVQSARGPHWYWLVSDCPLDRFTPVQKALAAAYGSDPHVADLPRVMRVPGFLHRKGAPALVTLAEAAGHVYALEQFPAPEPAAATAAVPAALDSPVTARYARAALTSACDRIRAAAEGQRNDVLNREAFGPGQLVAGNALSYSEAFGALLAAALAVGLTEAESRRTIESAFTGALREPRSTKPAAKKRLNGHAHRTAPGASLAVQPVAGVPEGLGKLLIWRLDARGNATKLENHLCNAIEILTHDERWKARIALNEFAQVIELVARPAYEPDGLASDAAGTWIPRPLRDDDLARIASWLAAEYRLMVGTDTVAQAANAVGHRNAYHPVRAYLDGLTWDGEPRLAHWLEDFCGATAVTGSGSYVHAVSRAWMISAVARVYRPGCKADHVLILEGAQGIKKSTVFRALGGEWFTDQISDLGSKDAALQVHGVWIVELAELDAMSRHEVSRVKAFLSVSFDRIRPPYGRTVMQYDRQCVFAGTVNHTDYLRDDTGNRRFWPVRCTDDRIDIAGLSDVRDQLWAEAVIAYRAGERWWLDSADDERAARAEQEERMSVDAWEDVVSEYLAEVKRDAGPLLRERAYVTVGQVLKRLNVPIERQAAAEQRRIVSILKHLGWQRRQIRRDDGIREWRYLAPQETERVTSVTTPEKALVTPKPADTTH